MKRNWNKANHSGRNTIVTTAWILLLVTLLLSGCTTVGTRSIISADDRLVACRALFQETDSAIQRAGVRDYGSSSVHGFPYLRTTRLLASFRGELIEQKRWSAWIGHMADLDAHTRLLELRNLSTPVMGHRNDTLHDKLNGCRKQLLAIDLEHPEQRNNLREAARVPNDYVTWWQVLGFYPLTAPFVSAGISAWHSKTHNTFATPLSALPVVGQLIRWAPPFSAQLNAKQVSEILRRSLDPLGIPLPMTPDLDQLFDTFAPVWEIDVVNNNDHIGMLRWNKGPMVDVARAKLYRRVSHTRFGNQVLLQLNYIVWFPARSGNDIYAGLLDGINWRVTLGANGKPLLYDAIHNCGCYHEFFPNHHLSLRGDLPSSYFEPPLIPQSSPLSPTAPGQQTLVLRIAHHTHFIQRIYYDESLLKSPPTVRSMAWEEYDALRSLPTNRGYHSLFGEHGLIIGTERTERFILWPMGIRSPGAMRQWGRHVTAFVGHRHFDDAFLIERLFERIP